MTFIILSVGCHDFPAGPQLPLQRPATEHHSPLYC